MEHRQEHRPLHREAELPPRQAPLHHRLAACILPQPLEDEPRSHPLRGHHRRLAAAMGVEHQQRLAEARRRAHQRVQLTRSEQCIQPPQRGHHPLPGTPVLPAVLDDLKVHPLPGLFAPQEHGDHPEIVTMNMANYKQIVSISSTMHGTMTRLISDCPPVTMQPCELSCPEDC